MSALPIMFVIAVVPGVVGVTIRMPVPVIVVETPVVVANAVIVVPPVVFTAVRGKPVSILAMVAPPVVAIFP